MNTEETNKAIDKEVDSYFETSTDEIIDGTSADEVLIHNAADPEQVKQGEKKIQIRERSERSDMLFLLSDVRGRRYLWKLFEMTKPFAANFIGTNEHLQFLTGRRSVGCAILDEIIQADPTAFGKMMTEFKGDTNGQRKQKRK